MVYIALLRGVNVGGKGMVSMAALRACFEEEGLEGVRTYINSGNVVFKTAQIDIGKLTAQLEQAIKRDTNMGVRVLVKTAKQLEDIATAVPSSWDDPEIRCYVLLLWPGADRAEVLRNIPINPEFETVRYVPGAVLHRYEKVNASKSRLNRLNGTPVYQDITIRNLNTIHKLVELSKTV